MDPALQTRLTQAKSMPTLPAVTMKVLEQCQKAEPNVRDVVSTITTDAALSAKVLKMANSPMLGVRREVTTVSHAVAMLGLNSLRAMALSFTLARTVKAAQTPWFRAYWKRSALSGLVSRHLAALVGVRDLEEAFLAGLMQDIGILTLATIEPTYGAILEKSIHNHGELSAQETELFGSDHAEVGAWLAEKWRLPAQFAMIIAHSHKFGITDDKTEPSVVTLSRIVATANHVTDIWLAPDRALPTRHARAFASKILNLTDEKFDELLARVHDTMGELFTLLEAPMDSQETIDEILEEAREALLLSAVSTEIQMTETMLSLTDRAEKAEGKSVTDLLTGLANRNRFETFIEHELTKARITKTPLSIIMVDVDHFKKVNDKHGHLVGDAVLKAIGGLLLKNFRPRDLPARWGGEEFVVVLPETPTPGALIVAERVRERVSQLTVQTQDGTPIPLTASFGCATVDAGQTVSIPALIAAADAAMYRAKESGRNRVCAADPIVAPISAAG